MDNILFVCDCEDVSHQMIISFDEDPIFNDMIFIHVHLSNVGIWKRLLYSIKYIMGKRSRFNGGAWGEILLNKEKTAKLIQTLQKHYEVMK